MTRAELIKRLEELDFNLMKEVKTDDLMPYARYQAHIGLEDAINHLKTNKE